MIASLPMYDRAETAAANDALWAAIRARLEYGPQTLTRSSELWQVWQSPDLLLAQTCGLPYRARLHPNVTLVGTPDYGLAGCRPGYYRSLFIARSNGPSSLADYAGKRFAYNEPLSQSGWAAPYAHMAELGLHFGPLQQSGAHRASALAVAEGQADFAAVDAVTWQFIQRHDPFATSLQVIAATTPTPGLPLITAVSRDPAPIFDAVSQAIIDLPAEIRSTLHLKGLSHIPASHYLEQPLAPAPNL
ncbi:PhnD/SsuA/transferrin family substrate-binding protein [Alisedimentitalea sp. MJ-SS2]|uniref:phosphate/phosphite/phosphonate ABC transporter substrate-binding protein n=1 Tax=Aliisedimentitalea sp. MJ-SS2 TaxID=3049795 RepID=UPI0029141113|nr:PhnD/SsuA/transferrin family substrate-binding protein [Alisedimentitalea sp. MJ-SS2]MDU8926421.1 PhnD/SsuA/transferrin family substrate-binding protein [Alisedimentitalea sp. MJ-SS2]